MMNQEPEETKIKELFQQLKQEDERHAPPFAGSWAAAQSRFAQRGQGWRLGVATASVLILVGLLGWMVYKSRKVTISPPERIARTTQAKPNENMAGEPGNQVQYGERERPEPRSRTRLGRPRSLPLPHPNTLPARDVAREESIALAPPEGTPFFDLETTRHLEKAQVLLRSFKNTSFSKGENLDYEKRVSRELLYRNILLRREAEAVENTPAKSLLSNLEPLLLDIANLPAKPASGELRSVKERIRKSEIVAVLQVYSTLTTSVE